MQRSRVCPKKNGACGGPDIAMSFGECNNIRCIAGKTRGHTRGHTG